MTLTKQQDQLITAAAGIMTDPATMQDSAFLARQLVQCTLPHKNPGNVEIWTRREGKAWLMVRRGYDGDTGEPYGIPYGSIPRLLLYWTITEAVRLRSRTLSLGHSLNDYLRKVGLNPATGGGKRGDAARVRGQSLKLFNASISFGGVAQDENGREGKLRANMEVTSRSKLWWNVKTPEQRSLWESEIILGEDFYNAVTAAPVPLDYRALRALKRSALGLDLYAWLALAAYRASTTGKAVWISWRLLGKALGAEYDRADNFQQKAKRELRKIRAVFPGLRLGQRRGGLEVLPTSSPPVLPRLGDVENRAK
jgi:Plasmid encoded RepA protein